jgi:PAS domain S-box-containing protein
VKEPPKRKNKTRKHPGGTTQDGGRDLEELIHSLHIHQTELEMQNDELRKAKAELEHSRSRYSALYDFAPVGYFTLDQRGLIVEANLTLADMLGVARGAIIKSPFSNFVAPSDRQRFLDHRNQTQRIPGKKTCELQLVRSDRTAFHTIVESIALESPLDNSLRLQSVAMDISQRKQAEEELEQSEKQLKFLSSELMRAQELERKRIAWEIHDGIGQSLASIKLTLERLMKDMRRKESDAWVEPLRSVLSDLQGVFAEVRRIQSNLRPSLLDDLGLEAAISWVGREMQKTNNQINIETDIHLKNEDIDDSMKTAIFRIVQEGLTNVVRHSKAKSVRISLRKQDSAIELSIRDNGRGFDTKKILSLVESERGIGLSSMKQRAEQSGGAFLIESLSGVGTTLKAVWPVGAKSLSDV